jgi:nitrous oxidase accessory protein
VTAAIIVAALGLHAAPAAPLLPAQLALPVSAQAAAVAQIDVHAGESIGAAVAAAAPGTRVVVHAGVYAEPTIVIDRRIELVGEGWPVLDGGGERQILTILADSVSVSGLVLRNVGTTYVEDRAAIRTDGVVGCRIERNRVENAFFGIYLARSADCVVAGNTITGSAVTESSAANGIHLWYSRRITISDNEVSGHRDGIYFEFVEDTRVVGNRSTRNLRYGLHFMFSSRCDYEDNVFERNAAGVAVMYSKDVTMLRNRFERNWGSAAYALLLKEITDSEVRDNDFTANSVGIYADGANRVRVEHNRFTRNGFAVRIMANSMDDVFTGNTFIGNSFDVTTNSRASYSTFHGNYWDAYRGYDLDRDGTGDVPFRPVRLFSLLVERNPPALLLLRSFVVTLLDTIERAVPSITPETLVDATPLMRPPS